MCHKSTFKNYEVLTVPFVIICDKNPMENNNTHIKITKLLTKRNFEGHDS